MKIVVPLDGRVKSIICSSFLLSRRNGESEYTLSGENFLMSGFSPDQILILPDDADVTEGKEITPELTMLALPIESFIAPSAEEALSDALGLVLRSAVADGNITNAELLRVAPALEGRLWQPGLTVAIGDVYSFGAFLWKCVQAHTTQGDWPPDRTPALWHKVEVITEGAVRVWASTVEYTTGDIVAYPNAEGSHYKCLQGHTSLVGWEPPNVPALWQKEDE